MMTMLMSTTSLIMTMLTVMMRMMMIMTKSTITTMLTLARMARDFTFSQPTPFQLPTLPRISLSMCPDASKTLVLYKSCTYLLTYLMMMIKMTTMASDVGCDDDDSNVANYKPNTVDCLICVIK